MEPPGLDTLRDVLDKLNGVDRKADRQQDKIETTQDRIEKLQELFGRSSDEGKLAKTQERVNKH